MPRVTHTATTNAPAVLQASGLTKVYGATGGATHTALDDFDLRVGQGEFLGVMGPSGSGKDSERDYPLLRLRETGKKRRTA